MKKRLTALTLLVLVLLAGSGFRGCGDRKTAEQNFVGGLRIAARAVPAGVETVRAFREAGEIKPEDSLALARLALDANRAAKNLTAAALEGADSATLAEQLDVVLTLALRLEQGGILRLKNGRTRLVFELGVIAAKNGLVIVRDELKGQGSPVRFTLDEDTKRALNDLLPLFVSNEKLLNEAIRNLEAVPQ